MTTADYDYQPRTRPSAVDDSENVVVEAAKRAHQLLYRLGPQFNGRVSVVANLPGGIARLTLKGITESDPPLFVENEHVEQNW